MNLYRVKRLALVPFAVLAAGFQCSTERDDTAINKCNCTTAPVVEEKKDVEAVVVQTPNIEHGQRIFALSIEPRDFGKTSYSVGPNILVPCDSLPSQYKQGGTMVIVSYRRKDCCGILTAPNFRSGFGCYVDLTAIKIKS